MSAGGGMDGKEQGRAHVRVAVACFGLVAVMLGAAYAAVPLYNMFCRATGFGGTTQVAVSAPTETLGREISVRFDGNVAPGLPWTFGPETNVLKVKVGESKLVFFKAKNVSDKPLVGTASYNVTPDQMGAYFTKIQCFCFTEQRLAPGEEIDMPVSFFVDPSLVENHELDRMGELTLSYTFHPVKEPKSASATTAEKPKT
jgi:cytochrome c oxidase assembly protein subunit 11